MTNNTENKEQSKLEKLANKKAKVIAETMYAITTCDTYEEAAKYLGISNTALANRRAKYDIDKKMAERTEFALRSLQEGSLKAANKLVKLIDDKRYEFEASKEVLDRVGVGTQKGGNTNIQVNVTPILGGDSVHDISKNNGNK